MGLVDLKTNLKSLRYGKDTIGGGSSNQPYVVKSIPEKLSDIGNTGGPDFLLRAGTLRAAANDVSRLTQMFFDFKSPNGPLFIAKQNALSLTNVNSSSGYAPFIPATADTSGNLFQRVISQIGTFVQNNISLNQGIYTPLGTIAQSGVNAFGTHLLKQGFNPVDNINPNLTPKQDHQRQSFGFSTNRNVPLAMPTYLRTIYTDGDSDSGPKTRMQSLFNLQLKSNDPNIQNLLTYSGGPGSTLGVGKTKIKVAPGQPSGRGSSVFLTADDDRYRSGNNSNLKNRFVLSQNEINSITPVGEGKGATYQNFSAPLVSQAVPQSIPWNTIPELRIDERVNLGNPGKRGNISSYVIGKRELNDNTTTIEGNSGYKNALDKITAFPLYQSQYPIQGENKKLINDLVKFRIGVINNNDPSLKTYIHFRAIIDSMNDSYTSNWEAQRFMGRGENFYKYDGFDRSISLSWTVAAQSKQELIPMYQKLNYLASVCAPDYSSNGYMRGNLISLTIGGYCYEQVGIMKGITLDVPTESPWEISINDSGTLGAEGDSVSDPSVKELPMIVKVTGFTFVPIHNFVPKIQSNLYGGNENPTKNTNGPISTYGKERYIGLEAVGNNYDGLNDNINYTPDPSNNSVSNSNTTTTPVVINRSAQQTITMLA